MFSFDYDLYTLEDFSAEFTSFYESKGMKFKSTNYLHILNRDFYLVSDVIVFEVDKDNIDKSTVYLYNKIRDKILNSRFNKSEIFYIHIGKQLLNALDFEILRLNSPNIGK
jgi:hypothetical protein